MAPDAGLRRRSRWLQALTGLVTAVALGVLPLNTATANTTPVVLEEVGGWISVNNSPWSRWRSDWSLQMEAVVRVPRALVGRTLTGEWTNGEESTGFSTRIGPDATLTVQLGVESDTWKSSADVEADWQDYAKPLRIEATDLLGQTYVGSVTQWTLNPRPVFGPVTASRVSGALVAKGRVTDPLGRPMSNLRVYVAEAGRLGAVYTRYSSRTNAQGRYTLRIPRPGLRGKCEVVNFTGTAKVPHQTHGEARSKPFTVR